MMSRDQNQPSASVERRDGMPETATERLECRSRELGVWIEDLSARIDDLRRRNSDDPEILREIVWLDEQRMELRQSKQNIDERLDSRDNDLLDLLEQRGPGQVDAEEHLAITGQKPSDTDVGEVSQELSSLVQKIERMRRRSEDRDKRKGGMMPDRHRQMDLFVAEVLDYSMKDDNASMEAPVFSLATRKDMDIWRWKSADGKKTVEVIPSAIGRATIHDKDILIYLTSQLVAATNRGNKPSRRVRFRLYDYFRATNKDTGGDSYMRVEETLTRLRGTTVKTNVTTGGRRQREGFGIIDSWRVVEKSPTDSRMIAVEVTLSEWLYNAVEAREVLTINRDYFRLRKPLERRLYEIARKHVGDQGIWEISEKQLHAKDTKTLSKGLARRALRRLQTVDKPDG